MNVLEGIAARRTIKSFTSEPVDPRLIERLLEAAVLAPNHRLTQPWRFLVLGPECRRAYGHVLGLRKAAALEDRAVGDALVAKLEREYAGLPAAVAVAMFLNESPEVREEDYAATFMAIENLCLAAVELGLGSHLKTGAVLADPRTRDALQVPPAERLVALVQLGHPAEVPQPKPRAPAGDVARWLP